MRPDCLCGRSGQFARFPDHRISRVTSEPSHFRPPCVYSVASRRTPKRLLDVDRWLSETRITLQPIGIALRSVTESFLDTGSPEGKAMFQVMGSFAELDKNQLVRKLKSGRIEKHERGGFSVGQVATGYQSFDGKLVVAEDWAGVVKRIYRMALQGLGVNRISRVLNEEGVTTKNNCRWYPRTVKLVLENRTYTGVVRNGSERRGVHEAIISPSMFGRVQRVMGR